MKCSRVVVVAVVAALALGACSSGKKGGSTPSGKKGNVSGTITVFTSGVFKDIIDRLVKGYTKNHTAAKINVVTKATQATLKATITGKKPSIILLVNPQFRPLGSDLKPLPLGQSRAVIAVSDKNPHKVTNVTAFATTSGLKTSLCGVRTGFGNTVQWVLYRSKIKPDPKAIGVGCEAKSMHELLKDQLDAVLLFRGGTYPPKGVKLLDIPEQQNIIFKLSYLVVGTSPVGTSFGAFLASKGAQQILTANGYLP
jgi:hypothetical protein